MGVTARLNTEGGNFYGIHRYTPDIPSVITEFLWLSNPSEANLLARPDVLEAEARAVVRGIDRFYRTAAPGSGFVPPFVDTFDLGGGGFDGCVDPQMQ